MALVIKDRVKETTTTTGTGTINLAGAASGFQSFVDGVGDGNTTYYVIEDANGTAWEVGIGTITDASPDTLARTTVLASTNSNSQINLSSGTHTVFGTYPAGKAVYLDASGNLSHTVALTTDTSGNYVSTITGGTGITSTGATSGEGIAHSLSVDASQTQITAVGTIATGTWQGTAIAQAYIANDAINGDKIADDAVNSEHYAAGSIDEEHLNATNSPTDNYILSYDDASGGFTWVAAGAGEANQNAFSTIAVTGQDNVAADSATDTLNLAAGSNITITTTAASDTVTIAATDTNTTYTGGTNLTLAGTTFNVDDAFLVNDADDTTTGTITAGGFTTAGTLTVDSVGITAIQTASESFADNDTSLMTSAAIDDRINAAVANEDTLAELNDTNISSAAAGHLIIYDNTASVWDNAALTAGSNISITNGDGSITIAATDTNTQLTTEQVEDIVGGMVTGNTETGITVTYEDGDGTLDFVVGTLNQDTTGNAATATALETARTINGTSFDGTANITITAAGSTLSDTVTVAKGGTGATSLTDGGILLGSGTDAITATAVLANGELLIGDNSTDPTVATLTAGSNISITNGAGSITIAATDTNTQLTTEQVQDIVGGMVTGNTETGIAVTYEDGDGTLDFVVGTLNQDTTGNAATATALETARTINGTSFDGTANITITAAGSTLSDTVTVAKGGTGATSLTDGGVLLGSGTDAITATAVLGNGELLIGDNSTDPAVATLTAGSNVTITNGAGTITIAADNDNTQLSTEQVQDIVGGMVTGNTETGIAVTYEDGDGTLDFVVGTLNQDTTGNAATATALETARTINGTSFDGTANITVTAAGSTLSDTVTVAKGGTGQTSYTNGQLLIGNTTGNTLAKSTLTAGSNVTITNGTGSITIAADNDNTQLSEEQVEDFVGGMVTGNTETGISVTYEDGDGTLDFVVSDTTVAGDSGSTGITPGDTLTIAGGTNATTAMSGDTLTVNVDDAFLKNNADDTTSGTVTMANLIVGDAGNIGSASDTDAIAIASDGEVTLSQRTTFSKAVKTPLKSNTDGSTITFDLDEASTHTVTLGDNRTLAISNEDAGQKFIINLVQDGTGSRTVTWFSTIKWAGGSAPTLTTTADKADSFGFLCTGTDAYYGFVIGQNI